MTHERRTPLDLDGTLVPVQVRKSARARRLILRVAFDSGDVVVTVPAKTPLEHGLVFAEARSKWILERLARVPTRVPFAPGAVIPVLGTEHRIEPIASRRPFVEQAPGVLRIGGDTAGVSGRLLRWLRRQALNETTDRSVAKADHLGVHLGRVGVRDTRTRWGSCSREGNLSYAWRLIMAPSFVLDYVVAHEVAHLRHRGHGEAFWITVDGLTDRMSDARAWLRRCGTTLYRYGPARTAPTSSARFG